MSAGGRVRATREAFARRTSPGLTLWLVVLWMMLFADLSWLTVLSGFLVALAVQWAFPLPRTGSSWHIRWGSLVVLLVRFVVDVIRAGVQVSWLVLSGRPTHSAILRVHLRSSDPVHLTAISAMTSLVPGTIVVRVDRLTATLYLHVLDIDAQGGPDAVREAVLDQEKRILYAIGSSVALHSWGLSTFADRLRASQGAGAVRRGGRGDAGADSGDEGDSPARDTGGSR